MVGDVALSVVICTRNRADALRRTLESLVAASAGFLEPFEIVVVDNASVDDTRAVVASYRDRLPVRLVEEPVAGLSRARNTGLLASRGRTICLTDDDCIVAPDWLAVAWDRVARHPQAVIGGRIVLDDARDIAVSIITRDHQARLERKNKVFEFVIGANLVFSRDVFERVGLFDVRLGAGTRNKSAEDIDFVYRAFCLGIEVLFEPGLLVRHAHGRQGERARYRHIASYAIGDGALVAKHLMHGDADLAKVVYWDLLGILRKFRNDREYFFLLFSKVLLIRGGLGYLAGRRAGTGSG